MSDFKSILNGLIVRWNISTLDSSERNTLVSEIFNVTSIIIDKNSLSEIPDSIWHEWLNISGNTFFLRHLSSMNQENQWSEQAFKIIEHSNYTLLRMFRQRVEKFQDKTLFRDMGGDIPAEWSYGVIFRKVKEIAAVLHRLRENETPRVAILCDNSVSSACADLACLCYDILDTPLSTHFEPEVIQHIIETLKVNIVITDSRERALKLAKIESKCNSDFTIITTVNIADSEFMHLDSLCAKLGSEEIDDIIESRKRFRIDEVATVMFTSGSTGLPKGVSFSVYNLVTKRFARSAALPFIGDNETLLCFLPLFHTFGRYLEMLGTIYWGGTYVFAGNPSADTLLALFPRVNPSIFISIPLRWFQLHEKCLSEMDKFSDSRYHIKAFRSVVGERLRWGLSAAGYLDPKVFRFFHRNGVELCSGFGMTEATGGITMTSPGGYVEGSVGKALPGVYTKLSDKGELLISGHYIASYLENARPGERIEIPEDNSKWPDMPTGDIFRVDSSGHYEIIDRLKDIYKNIKGQTIAPKKIEKKFESVPGIKNTFLVGDGRAYNNLLIVPDNMDPVFVNMPDEENKLEYFHNIVTKANADLPFYERVVNFKLLENDFDAEKGELTPKGSFNRKNIIKNYSKLIENLYAKDHIHFFIDGINLKVPLWFFRDIGILEDDIQVINEGLINKRNNQKIRIEQTGTNRYIIGDYEYISNDLIIDFGIFFRHPFLWAGNTGIMNFGKCKEGWETNLKGIQKVILRPYGIPSGVHHDEEELIGIKSVKIRQLHHYFRDSLFGEKSEALNAITELSGFLDEGDLRISGLVRSRMEALARHPEEDVRAKAYMALLMAKPNMDYSKAFPAFLESGMAFLTKKTIYELADSDFGKRRLEQLRQRLFNYRTQLKWPANEIRRKQFSQIFQLLTSFVSRNEEYYASVRAELASWILLKHDKELSKIAIKFFDLLSEEYEMNLLEKKKSYPFKYWEDRIIFEDGLSDFEIKNIKNVLVDTTFLKQSVILAFEEEEFEISDVPERGIWISRIIALHHYIRYRISINTISGKHFDLQLIIQDSLGMDNVPEFVYWYAALGGYPFNPQVLPRLGCCRPELKAFSLEFNGNLSVWEKIREFSSARLPGKNMEDIKQWKKLFIESIAAFFRVWIYSGKQVVPGISPGNVVISELDFRPGASIMSMTGLKRYMNTMSIIKPVINNFYMKTFAHYPWSGKFLKAEWIFDACIEAMGRKDASHFFELLKHDLDYKDIKCIKNISLSRHLNKYIEKFERCCYRPLALQNAIDRYISWLELNHEATTPAREQNIIEIIKLYELNNYPEIVRYLLYKETYFVDFPIQVHQAFDNLISKLGIDENSQAVRLLELSELQSMIKDKRDRAVFSRLVFPKVKNPIKMEVTNLGSRKENRLVVSSEIMDKQKKIFTVREPVSPAEVGHVYRLFYTEKYPKTVSKSDNFFVVLDEQDRIVSGICYKYIDEQTVHIDGTVVVSQLKGRGIGTALVEDFFNRMLSKGIEAVTTYFFLRAFYNRLGFRLDKKWGALVKFLEKEEVE